MFIYLDESGNFKGKKEDYFIVGGFITGDPHRTSKMFRKWQHKKFPKKLRYYNKGKNGKKYFSMLKSSIVGSKEMFEKYWEDFYKKTTS